MNLEGVMDNLHLEKTKYTLGINFNAESGVLGLEGCSYPENAFEFYQPIKQWLKSFIAETQKPIICNLRLQYLNTSSSKCLMDIFQILEGHLKAGRAVEINWYYQKDDEDLLETGVEYSHDTELKFNLIPS
jgi:hypothetical protein